ncbi:MAG TPA: hypothetical protein VGO22_10815 [Pseudorhizobium sp.]|nr:hypothetical protein [Pseudorhizobium sp.]
MSDGQNTVDLSRFEALVQSQEEGIEFDLVDELGKPIGLKIGLVGPDSKRTRKAMKEVAAEFSKLAEDRALAGTPTPEDEDDQRQAAFLSKVTTHWSPDPSIGGKAVPFTEENARTFFTRFRIFAEQVEARVVRRGPFAKSSSSGSAS